MRPAPEKVARAIYAARVIVEAELERAGVRAAELDDAVQQVAIDAVRAAAKERLAWTKPWALRAWIRVVAWHVGERFRADVARREILVGRTRMEGLATVPPAEDALIAMESLRIAANATTPQRWRALRSFMAGVPIAVIAARANMKVPSAYGLLQQARKDIAAALGRADLMVPPRRR